MFLTFLVPLFTLACSRLSYAQQLVLNKVLSLSLNASTPDVSMTLPSSDNLQISVAICTSTKPFPTFTLKNIVSKTGGMSSFSVPITGGVGVWQGRTTGSGSLDISVEGSGGDNTWSLEVGVSDKEPLHRSLSVLPALGDTTSTQALILSPPFLPPRHLSPSFPNYTLPAGNISWPEPPAASAQPNFTLVFVPTSEVSSNLDESLTNSACAILSSVKQVEHSFIGTDGKGGINGSISLVLPDYRQGWQTQWLLEGLTTGTNYTTWVLQDQGLVAGPIFAFTKSSSFSCTLAHSMPFCPQISYSIPLSPPSDASTYTAANLPASISDSLISSISNFTVALLTFPCGRDIYSFKQTCEDCADAYRQWACALSLPRCGELPPTLTSTSAQTKETHGPALLQRPVGEGRANLSSNNFEYTELLPCLETCYAVDRACPPLFGWGCPLPLVNANWSYGVGFIDSFDGQEGKGTPGVAQDRWGVSWCNG